MPKVSICIPTYNQVEYLKKCIQSVLAQDYKDYEIVVSDDSTNTDVEDFISSIQSIASVRYYKNSPSLGPPSNWNFAITKANGEYIKILHHDDFFNRKDSLRLFVESLDNNPDSDFAFSATLVWHVNNDFKRVHSCSVKKLEILKSDPEYLFFNNFIGAPSATIYRKVLAIKFDEQFKWLVDVDFYIAALKQNHNVVYIDTPLICTAHGAIGQVTKQVEYDKAIQIKEHVLLLERVITNQKLNKLFLNYFDELFLRYSINTLADVEKYVGIPESLNEFLKEVLGKLNSYKIVKRIKYRLLNSKYNKRYFKIEKYRL